MESSAVEVNRHDRGEMLAGRQIASRVAGRQVTVWHVERWQSDSVAGQPDWARLAPHIATLPIEPAHLGR